MQFQEGSRATQIYAHRAENTLVQKNEKLMILYDTILKRKKEIHKRVLTLLRYIYVFVKSRGKKKIIVVPSGKGRERVGLVLVVTGDFIWNVLIFSKEERILV